MKKLGLLVLLASISLMAVSAQEEDSGDRLTEMSFFAVETSIVGGYSLDLEDLTAGYSLIVNFPVAKNFTVGFQGLKGGLVPQMAGMKLSYYLNKLIGFSATFGGDGLDTWVGIGGFVSILTSSSGDSFATAMRIRLESFANTQAFDTGSILMGIGFALGI